MNKKGSNSLEIACRGSSMMPLIRDGDKVSIELIKPNQRIHLGEVVVFLFHKRLLCHRIMWIDKQTFITKGDNSWRGETSKPLKKIIGKVKSITGPGKIVRLKD